MLDSYLIFFLVFLLFFIYLFIYLFMFLSFSALQVLLMSPVSLFFLDSCRILCSKLHNMSVPRFLLLVNSEDALAAWPR